MGIFEHCCYHIPYNGQTDYTEKNWYFGETGTVLQPIKLEDQVLFEPGKTYTLSTDLTYDGSGDQYPSAMVTAGNVEIEAYLDDTLVFHYTKEDRGFSTVQGIGGAYFSISLGSQCEGKTLRFEIATPMNYPSLRRMPNIHFGDYATMMHNLLTSYLPGIITSFLITSVVIVLVLLGGSVTGNQWTYIHFAVFSQLIVMYRFSQNLFFLFMWGNPYMSYLCEYFCIVSCPIPLLLSYRHKLNPYCKKVFNVLVTITSLNLAVQLILHYTGLVDVIQMITLTHIILGITAVALGAISIYVRYKYGSQHLIWKILPILIGAVLDFTSYYWHHNTIGAGGFYSVGEYVGIGLLTTLILMVLEARKERVQAYKDTERSHILERLAYTDTLTNLGNRAAFDREITEISNQERDFTSMLVVSADLNGLKQINDTLGHAAGDRQIQRAADLMYDLFHTYGSVFRTGGDEFFAFLYNVDETDWSVMIKQFEQELAHRNQNEDQTLSIAVGCCQLDEKGINHCLFIADQRMYENKSMAPEHRENALT